MKNIANLEIGDTFYSPVTKKTYEVHPATCVCAGCAFCNSHECFCPRQDLGVEELNCFHKIFKEVKKMNSLKEAWKPGNIVICEDESRYYIITNESGFAVGLDQSICRSSFKDDGTSSYYSNIKAIANHSSGSYGKGFKFNLSKEAEDYEDIIWKSEDAIQEMTIAEIEKKLGMQSGTLRVKK